MCHAIKMPDTILITELQNQLALMQAKLDALQEDKVEMQSRIDVGGHKVRNFSMLFVAVCLLF